MTQINIRVDDNLDEIITFLAQAKKTTKASISKELIQKALNVELLPILSDLYKQGKISLKKIVLFTGLDSNEVIEKISKLIDESPITPEIDDYTSEITKKIIEQLK